FGWVDRKTDCPSFRWRAMKIENSGDERHGKQDCQCRHQPIETLADSAFGDAARYRQCRVRRLPMLRDPFQLVAYIARRLPSFLRFLGETFFYQAIERSRC